MSALRRQFIRTLSAASMAAFTVPGVFARQLARATTVTTESTGFGRQQRRR